MKKFVALLLLTSSFCYAPSITKPRTKRIQKSTGDIKQAIAQELDSCVTTCLSSINSLTEIIDVIRQKLKALVSGNDSFYAKQKAKKLEVYKKELRAMRQMLEAIELKLDKELKSLNINFSK